MGDGFLSVCAFLVGLGGFALAAEAELVDLADNVFAGEMGAGEREGAVEAEAVSDGCGAGGQVEFGMHLHLTSHEGRPGFDGEQEDVLDEAGIDGDVEADVATGDAGGVDDFAPSHDVGVLEPRVDGLEVGVAVGAVNDGVEGGVEGQGTFGDVEAEVRSGGGAVDDDAVELALVAAVGGEDAANAFNGAEVGVAESVAAVDRCVAGAVCVEGTEVAGGVDVADGERIDEDGMETHGLAGGDGMKLDLIDDEVEGDFTGLAVFDDEVGAVDVNFVDEDFDAAVALVFAGFRTLVHARHAGALGFGWQMDIEAGDLNAIDDQRGVEELTPVVDAEGEAVDLDEGIGHVEVIGIELEAGAGDLEAAKEGGVELIELDAAVKAGAEGFDDFGLERGACAVQEDVGGGDGRDEQDEEDGDDPEENSEEGAMTAGRCCGIGCLVDWIGHICLLYCRIG